MSHPNTRGPATLAAPAPSRARRPREPYVVIVRRTEGGPHSGQLAFPGGVIESHDPSPFAAACREAEEEIGLPRDAAIRLADLPVVETRVTGFRILPFLARIRRPAEWAPQPAEIAEVIEVSLAALAEPSAHGWADDLLPGARLAMRLPQVAARAADRAVELKGPSIKVGLDAQGQPSQALVK